MNQRVVWNPSPLNDSLVLLNAKGYHRQLWEIPGARYLSPLMSCPRTLYRCSDSLARRGPRVPGLWDEKECIRSPLSADHDNEFRWLPNQDLQLPWLPLRWRANAISGKGRRTARLEHGCALPWCIFLVIPGAKCVRLFLLFVSTPTSPF